VTTFVDSDQEYFYSSAAYFVNYNGHAEGRPINSIFYKLNLDSEQLSYTTQTTLSIDDTQQIVDALKHKFTEALKITTLPVGTSSISSTKIAPLVLSPSTTNLLCTTS
jgi:hypothetical protein